MKNTTLITALLFLLTGYTYAQQTYVPDDNFENYLETHDASGNTVAIGDANSMGNGVANDDYVLTSRISNVTSLRVYNQNISDLTGIADFAALKWLACHYNQLTNLDVSHNPVLKEIYCTNNQLTSLNISHNTNLEYLYCQYNQLTSLDVSQNTILKTLRCGNNQLTGAINIHNDTLERVFCSYNQLTSLSVIGNNLDLLECRNNQLTFLNSNARAIYCLDNQLTNLDFTQNTDLEVLWCQNNQLTTLDIRNGNNTNLLSLEANNNPYLTCVFVDDVGYMNTNWYNSIDATATYVETQAECDALSIDESFKENIHIYPNPIDEYLNIRVPDKANIKSISIQNMQGQIVYQSDFAPQIKLADLPVGMYFLRIENKTGYKALFKLIKD